METCSALIPRRSSSSVRLFLGPFLPFLELTAFAGVRRCAEFCRARLVGFALGGEPVGQPFKGVDESLEEFKFSICHVLTP